jgi:hypothetical protein
MVSCFSKQEKPKIDGDYIRITRDLNNKSWEREIFSFDSTGLLIVRKRTRFEEIILRFRYEIQENRILLIEKLDTNFYSPFMMFSDDLKIAAHNDSILVLTGEEVRYFLLAKIKDRRSEDIPLAP